MRFQNRAEAGRQLAARLQDQRSVDTVVIALPRGGVPVGHEVAQALGAPLDVVVALEVGAPARPETAIGVLSEGGGVELFEEALWQLGLSQQEIQIATRGAVEELDRRVKAFRNGRPRLDVSGKAVVLVGDGLIDPAPSRAAAHALREQRPRSLVLAVPVARASTVEAIRGEFDEVICLDAPKHLLAIGLSYQNFAPCTDEEVAEILAQVPAVEAMPPAEVTSAATRP